MHRVTAERDLTLRFSPESWPLDTRLRVFSRTVTPMAVAAQRATALGSERRTEKRNLPPRPLMPDTSEKLSSVSTNTSMMGMPASHHISKPL